MDKKQKQQPRKTSQKPKFGEMYLKDNPTAGKIAGAVSIGLPFLAVGAASAIDKFDKFKQEQKRKKLRAETGPKFQNRTKIKGVSSAKIIKLP